MRNSTAAPRDGLARFAIALMLVIACSNTGCDNPSGAVDKSPSARAEPGPVLPSTRGPVTPETQQDPSPYRFADIAADAGVDFQHVSGMTPERHFPSANGSGLAIFDYDNDGWMDLYFASCIYLPLGTSDEGQNRLYRNLGNGKFEDVTEKSGLGFHGFCHGIVTADFDNDGDQDVFLATFQQNTYYVNNGNGTFREAGVAAGVAPPAFRGSLVSGGTGDDVLTIDAVPGLKWRVGEAEPRDVLTIDVRKGQRLVFRQADTTASRGIDILIDSAHVVRSGERPRPESWLREIPGSPPRAASSYPALAAGEAPFVLAEYEVLADFEKPVPFQCSVHRPAWSSGGAAIDYDNDGDLDLYVTNYGLWTIEQNGSRFCGNREKNVRQYCSPMEVVTGKHLFYRNDGVVDGVTRFTDVYDDFLMEQKTDPETKQQILVKRDGRSDGHGFGVVAADIDGDGDIDLHIANDENPAFTFLNLGNGTFLDATESSSAGYDERGNTQSGMGVDAEDIDGDGLAELFRTNFATEYNTLYKNLGNATFYDQTSALGLAKDAMRWIGWGCALGDFDNDGWPDVFVTNGHVDNNYHLLGNMNTPYEEPALLQRNIAGKAGNPQGRKFTLATRGVGPYFDTSHVGRGAAFGDIDNDGDLDIVVNHKDGKPAILRNDTPGDNRWIRLNLKGTKSNRDAAGTQIKVEVDGLPPIFRQRKTGTSMESTNDPRVLIGVGPQQTIKRLTITWPSKSVTTLENVPTNQQLDLTEPAK